MRNLITSAMVLMFAFSAFAADEQKKDDNKTFYAIGLVIARQLSVFNLTPSELESVKQGITDGVTGKKPQVKLEEYNGKIQELAKIRRTEYSEKLAADAKSLTAKMSSEKGSVKTKSGVIYVPEKEGKGTAPALNDKVTVNYRGTLADGKEFDNSYKRGQPAEFQLSNVIACWKEGVAMMKPGGKARLFCPPETAYGENGNAVIPPNAALIFDVELLDVKK